jgi:hypothetical protein
MLHAPSLQAWLHQANPLLAELISARIGPAWRTDLGELRRLAVVSEDVHFRQQFARIKQHNKQRVAEWLWPPTGSQGQPYAWLELHLVDAAQAVVLRNKLLCAADVVCCATGGSAHSLLAEQAAMALNGVLLLLLLLSAANRHSASIERELALAAPEQWLRQAVLRMAQVGDWAGDSGQIGHAGSSGQAKAVT